MSKVDKYLFIIYHLHYKDKFIDNQFGLFFLL